MDLRDANGPSRSRLAHRERVAVVEVSGLDDESIRRRDAMQAEAVAKIARFIGIALLAVSLSGGSSQAQWTAQVSGTKTRFRGLCVVDSKVVWASGTQGTVLRTIDGGRTWQAKSIPGTLDLDFRDIHAVDERTAHALSSGEGEKSRIYRTTDGGNTWTVQHINRDPKGF